MNVHTMTYTTQEHPLRKNI